MKTQIREEKPAVVRNEDMIPGVLYGHAMDPKSIKVPRKEFFKEYERHGQSSVFSCEVDGESHKVYIKDIQRDVLNHEKIIHFDLLKVTAKDKIHARIPIHLEGKDVVEKGGLIVQSILTELDAKYSINESPEDINIDVSKMVAGDTMLLSDVKLPDYLEVLDAMDSVVVTVTVPKIETESEEEGEATEPELIGEKTE